MAPRFLSLAILLLTPTIAQPMCDPCNVRESAYLPSNGGPVSVAYSSNGCLAVANQGNNTVSIYSTNTTNCNANTQPITTLTSANGISNPRSVAFSSNGCLAVANFGNAPANSTVTIYAVNSDCTTTSLAPVITLDNATSDISNPTSVAFSSNGCLAVANQDSNTVTIYPIDSDCMTTSQAPVTTLISGINLPLSVAFSSNGCLAVANNGNSTVTIYHINANCTPTSPVPIILNSAMSNINFPRSVAFSPNGCLAVANANNTVTIYDIDSNCMPTSLTPTTTLNNLMSNISNPRSVAFSPNGCLAVANPGNDTVTIYDIDSNCMPTSLTPTTTLNNITSSISNPRSVAFSSNGCLAVANQNNNTVTIYDIDSDCMTTSQAPITTLNIATSGISNHRSVAFSSNGCLAVANLGNAPANSTVTIYAINSDCTATSLAPITILNNATSGISRPKSVAFSSNGCLAVANASNAPVNDTVTIYAVNSDCTSMSQAPITTLDNAISNIRDPRSVAFSSNGCLAVANVGNAPVNDTITIYAINSDCTATNQAPITTLDNATSGINFPVSVAFSSNGCLAIANLGNDTVTIFVINANCTTASPVPIILNNATSDISNPVSVAFSPNGCLAVANQNNDTVTIYAINADCTTTSQVPIATLDNTTSGISSPQSVAFSSNGCLAVANQGNSTVTIYDINADCTPTNPVPIATLDNTTSGISNPVSVAFSSNGCLSVANVGPTGKPGVLVFKSVVPLAPVLNTATSNCNGDLTLIGSEAEANAIIQVFADGNTIGSGVAAADGTFNFIINTSLASGVHTITITQTNSLSCTSAQSNALNIAVDCEPTINLKVILCGPKCRTTRNCKPRIRGRATPGSTICVYANNKCIGKTKANNIGKFCIVPCRRLHKGCNTIVAVAHKNKAVARSNAVRVLVKCR